MAKRAKTPPAAKKPGPTPGLPPVIRGDRVRELRAKRGMTQADLAYVSRVSAQQLNAIEGGRRDLQLRGFKALVESLKTSADYLLGLTDKP